MRNEEQHNGLDKKEIRDFLAKQLGRYSYDGEVDAIKKRIDDLQADLERAKRSKAARDLIALNGWQIFDISDDIDDYDTIKYFEFVGTQEERDQVFGL
jgi:hypothetical protein